MRISARTGKVAIAAITAGVAAIATGGIALAEGNGVQLSKYQELRTHAYTYDNNTGASTTSTCSAIAWKSTGTDSPIDNNTSALAVHVCAPTASTSDYVIAWSRASLNIDSLVGDVKNLSYDFRSDLVGAGAPRISVQFNNGDVGYLAASSCAHAFAVAPSWSRADFTGATSDCSFNVTGATGGTYAADGTNSAWDVYAAANPTQFVNQAYLVFDEAGHYRLDRIALGTAYLYNYSNTRGYACNGSEYRC
jgi:hypothetical protein